MILRPPRSTRTDTLFPYTTLFRSCDATLLPRNGRHRRLLQCDRPLCRDEPAHVLLTLGGDLDRGRRNFVPQTVEQSRAITAARSEERRVGKECVSPCRYGRSPYHQKKNKKNRHWHTQLITKSYNQRGNKCLTQ